MKVLHVDDEQDIRLITQLSLQIDGRFDVVSVDSGAAALDQIEMEVPDLILLDVMMPGMSGPDLRAILSKDRTLAKIPVIFMTAAARPETTQELMEIGAAGVIEKPFDPMELTVQVAEIFDRLSTSSNSVVA